MHQHGRDPARATLTEPCMQDLVAPLSAGRRARRGGGRHEAPPLPRLTLVHDCSWAIMWSGTQLSVVKCSLLDSKGGHHQQRSSKAARPRKGHRAWRHTARGPRVLRRATPSSAEPRVARGRRALAAPQSRRQPRRRPRDSGQRTDGGRRHCQPSRPDPPQGDRRTRRWRVSSQGAGENINKWQRQSALHDLVPLVVDTHGRTGREFVRQVIVRGARSAGLGCAWGCLL